MGLKICRVHNPRQGKYEPEFPGHSAAINDIDYQKFELCTSSQERFETNLVITGAAKGITLKLHHSQLKNQSISIA